MSTNQDINTNANKRFFVHISIKIDVHICAINSNLNLNTYFGRDILERNIQRDIKVTNV